MIAASFTDTDDLILHRTLLLKNVMQRIQDVEEVELSLLRDDPKRDNKSLLLKITQASGEEFEFELDGLQVADLLADAESKCGIIDWDRRSL